MAEWALRREREKFFPAPNPADRFELAEPGTWTSDFGQDIHIKEGDGVLHGFNTKTFHWEMRFPDGRVTWNAGSGFYLEDEF